MIHPFYIQNGLRVHEIPVGKKCPIAVGWPSTHRQYEDVERELSSGMYNKYGWLLDDDHLVVDIDLHNDEENGYESLKKLESDIGIRLIDHCGAVVQSPSGGCHFYFRKPANATFGKTFKSKYPGIDFIHGVGKQVIAAGSYHDSHPGKTYAINDSPILCDVPDELLRHLQSIRKDAPAQVTSSLDGRRSGDEYNRSERGLRHLISCMEGAGYVFRKKHDYYEWDRPGKTTDSNCSGHAGKLSKNGNYQLTCFTLSDSIFPSGESMTIFHAYSLLMHGGEDTKAASALFDEGFSVEDFSGVDLSLLLGDLESTIDDEEFIGGCVPSDGILKQVFDFYCSIAHRRSNVMGMAVAVSFCEVLFGRKVASHTDLRTNDYNVIIAPTNSGKEACEKTIIKIFASVDPDLQSIIPPDVQSGNGLIKALADRQCALWISDEFGKVLAAVLDKKQRNHHLSSIATHLLKLYGKSDSTYLGSAHAAGTQNAIIQPHLCVLGLTTGSTLFETTSASNVSDGLFGRIAFWPIQERPQRREMQAADVPAELSDITSQWIDYLPGGNLAGEHPQPNMLRMTNDARCRWLEHQDAIDAQMERETELRAAVWGRVAARSMKLALVHRVARLWSPQACDWSCVEIEREDIDWGICLANWLARVCCQLISENFANTDHERVKLGILKAVADLGEVPVREFKKAWKTYPSNEIEAAAESLQNEGKISISQRSTGGRPKLFWIPAAR